MGDPRVCWSKITPCQLQSTVNLRQVDQVQSDRVQSSFFICDPKIHSVMWILRKLLKRFCNIGWVDDLKHSRSIRGIDDLKLSRNIGGVNDIKLSHSTWGIGDLKLSRNVGVNDLKLSHEGYEIIWYFK